MANGANTNNGTSNALSSVAKTTTNQRIDENKSIDSKTEAKSHSVKREMTTKPQVDENKNAVNVKCVSNNEYLMGCIKAVVVSTNR